MLTVMMPKGESAGSALPNANSIARTRYMEIRNDHHLDVSGYPAPMASVVKAIATMTEVESVWLESAKHSLAAGMRRAWAGMVESPESEAHARHFCRGLECLLKYAYHRDYDVDAILERMRAARATRVDALLSSVYAKRSSSSEARRVAVWLERLSAAQNHWLASDPDPYAAHVRALLVKFCEHFLASEAELLLEALEEITALGLGEVAASRAQSSLWSLPAAPLVKVDMEIMHAEYAYCLARWHKVIILHWRTAPTAAAIGSIGLKLRNFSGSLEPNGAAMLVRIAAGNEMPDAPARRANAELLARHQSVVRACAVVIEDRGTLARLKRAVITAFQSVLGGSITTRYFGEVDEASLWLADMMNGDMAGLQEAIRSVERALEEASGKS